MPWVTLKPSNVGGGRQAGKPTARLYPDGKFILSHAAVALLGEPARVVISVNMEERAIRIQPTTPEDRGGFSLSGGGNSPHRLNLSQARGPGMIGEYRVLKIAGGIMCRRKEETEE